MIRRLITTVVPLLTLTGAAGAAHAEEAPRSDWRLGVEVATFGGLGGLSSLIGLSNLSTVGAGVEARLGDRAWLVFSVDGHYDGGASHSRSLGARVGARYTVVDGPVDVALGVHAVGSGADEAACYTSDGQTTCSKSDSAQLAGVVDLAARVALTDNILLSVTADLLEAGYRHSKYSDTVDEGAFVELSLRTRLGLFVAF